MLAGIVNKMIVVKEGLSQKELEELAAHYPFSLAEFTKCHEVLVPLMAEPPKGFSLTLQNIRVALETHAELQCALGFSGLIPEKIKRMVTNL